MLLFFLFFIVTNTFCASSFGCGSDSRRTRVLISNSLDENFNNEQVKIRLHTKYLISTKQMSKDCSLSVFEDETDITVSSFIEGGCGTDNTEVWMKINIDANEKKWFKICYTYDEDVESVNNSLILLGLTDDVCSETERTVSDVKGYLQIAEETISGNIEDYPNPHHTHVSTGKNVLSEISSQNQIKDEEGTNSTTFISSFHKHYVDYWFTPNENEYLPHRCMNLCRNGDTKLYMGDIILYDQYYEDLPTGFEIYTELDDLFPYVNNPYGSEFSCPKTYNKDDWENKMYEHNHNVGMRLGESTNNMTTQSLKDTQNGEISESYHAHNCSNILESKNAEHFPKHYNFLFAKKTTSTIENVPGGSLVFLSEIPDMGYDEIDFDAQDLFIRGSINSSIVNTTSGYEGHSHYISGSCSGGVYPTFVGQHSNFIGEYDYYFSPQSHSHTVSFATKYVYNEDNWIHSKVALLRKKKDFRDGFSIAVRYDNGFIPYYDSRYPAKVVGDAFGYFFLSVFIILVFVCIIGSIIVTIIAVIKREQIKKFIQEKKAKKEKNTKNETAQEPNYSAEKARQSERRRFYPKNFTELKEDITVLKEDHLKPLAEGVGKSLKTLISPMVDVVKDEVEKRNTTIKRKTEQQSGITAVQNKLRKMPDSTVNEVKNENAKMDKVDKILMEEQKNEIAKLNINKKLFEINFDEIDVIKSIGKGGSNSVVFLAKWNGIDVAFKCFKLTDLMFGYGDGDDNMFNDFEREVGILASVSYPYILDFFGATLSPPRVGIVCEYCNNGTVQEYMEKYEKEHDGQKVPMKERVRFLWEICSAMAYLHSKSIIHRDLKCENVLVNNNITMKVMDFGLSKMTSDMKQSKTKNIGTSKYMAPEVVKGSDYTEKCDIFSFGILMYEVITGNFNPYGKNVTFNIEYRVSTEKDFRPDTNEIKMNWVKNLCVQCWDEDEKERPSFKYLQDKMKTTIAVPENLQKRPSSSVIIKSIKRKQEKI